MSRTPEGIQERDRGALNIAARRVLLDGLEALAEQADAVTIVGAQAIYLRFERLLTDERTADVTKKGLADLRSLFGAERTIGTLMAADALAGDPVTEQVQLIGPSYVRALPEPE